MNGDARTTRIAAPERWRWRNERPMKQALLQQGRVIVADVPAPQAEPGAVLVRTAASCISVGTELSGVKASNLPLWKRALQRPDQVRRIVQMVRIEGISRTQELVRSRLGQAFPM